MRDLLACVLLVWWLFGWEITIPWKLDGTWHELVLFAEKPAP